MATNEPHRSSGAKPVGDSNERRSLGWLWPLLGLLALVAVAAVILPLLFGDSDDDDARAVTPPAETQPAAPPPVDEQAAGTADPDGDVGELTVDGQPLLPIPPDGLAQFNGQRAEGNNLLVQEVVAEQGFYVGPEDGNVEDWVFVEFGGDTGVNEQGTLPEEGQRVRIIGPVSEVNDAFINNLDLTEEQEQALQEQGAYINAELANPVQE